MRGVVFPLLFAALVVGCYSPHYDDCVISCPNEDCPSGYDCRAGMCRPHETSGNCGQVTDDGGPPDTAVDASPGTGAWASPMMVTLGSNDMVDPTLTADMLEMYVNINSGI